MVTIILTQYLFYRNGDTLSNSNSSYMSNNETAYICNINTVVQKEIWYTIMGKRKKVRDFAKTCCTDVRIINKS